MTPIPEERWELLAQLQSAIGRIAASADDQIAYLTNLSVAPQADELALELDDLLVVALGDQNLLETPQREALIRLDDALKRMSGPENSHLWTTTALQHADEWRQLRDLARVALEKL